jgi:hypothetical protein
MTPILMDGMQNIAKLDIRALALYFVPDVLLECDCVRLLRGYEGKRLSSPGVPFRLFLDEAI